MPSPIGHALAGAAIAWTVTARRTRREAALRSSDAVNVTHSPDATQATLRPHAPRLSDTAMLWICVGLAAAPDLDLIAPYTHRTITHSLLAVASIAIVTIAVTGRVTRRLVPFGVLACTLAYASHLALDWMAVDDSLPRGIQLLWPFDDRWFISGWDLFRGTARRDIFTATSMRTNALAILQEVAMLGPIAALTYRWSRRNCDAGA